MPDPKIILILLFVVASNPWAASNAYADGLKDVKPPLSVPFPWGWVGILFLGLSVIIFYLLLRKRLRTKTAQATIQPQILKHPWEAALERLMNLKQMNWPAQGKLKDYYVELSLIVRQYIEDRFNIHAKEMTTEEFLKSLKDSQALTLKAKTMLKDFLSSSDLVKFAKYGPSAEEVETAWDSAKSFIEQTKGLEPSAQTV